MRLFLLAALAVTAFAATLAIDLTDANAVVCARGPTAPAAPDRMGPSS